MKYLFASCAALIVLGTGCVREKMVVNIPPSNQAQGMECSVQKPCSGDFSCVNGRCVFPPTECQNNADCKNGYGCLQGLCTERSAEVDKLIEKQTPRTLATSPDRNFVLLGYGTCKGVFSIYKPTAKEFSEQGKTGVLYELGYSSSESVPETEDLGSVFVQTKSQYATSKSSHPIVYETTEMVVSATLTNAATLYHDEKQDCDVRVSEK
jgi:hypothetical protein